MSRALGTQGSEPRHELPRPGTGAWSTQYPSPARLVWRLNCGDLSLHSPTVGLDVATVCLTSPSPPGSKRIPEFDS